MGNRKAAEAFILEWVEKLLPDGRNQELYRLKFSKMSDDEFADYMQKLSTEEEILNLIAPNGAKVKLETKRNLDLAKELGYEFFQRIWKRTPDGNSWYLSYDKYLVVHLPVRRQAQLLIKKISIAEDNRSVDDLTGQPTGKSKSSKVSYPEVQMLASLGLNNMLSEFMKYRGGDEKGFQAMEASISRTGGVSLKAIAPYSGTVKSTQTLSSLLTAMHLGNNLLY